MPQKPPRLAGAAQPRGSPLPAVPPTAARPFRTLNPCGQPNRKLAVGASGPRKSPGFPPPPMPSAQLGLFGNLAQSSALFRRKSPGFPLLPSPSARLGLLVYLPESAAIFRRNAPRLSLPPILSGQLGLFGNLAISLPSAAILRCKRTNPVSLRPRMAAFRTAVPPIHHGLSFRGPRKKKHGGPRNLFCIRHNRFLAEPALSLSRARSRGGRKGSQ